MNQQDYDLIIPVYLNQRIVFDLIAMLQGGISTVTKVASIDTTQNDDQRRYGADFGLSKALSSLLKITVGGSREIKKGEGKETKIDQEKVHTPASLFYTVRRELKQEGKLIIVDPSYKPISGAMVEFSASLHRNPFIQTMDSMLAVMDMAIAFEGDVQKGTGQKPSKNPNYLIKEQMANFTQKLKSGETVDIVSDLLPCGYKAVITLELEYLNDPAMSDLVDGQFNVLGKIIRVINNNETGAINLLRKTAFTVMPKSILGEMRSKFRAVSLEHGLQLPELEWEAKGPVFHLLPVAIFT